MNSLTCLTLANPEFQSDNLPKPFIFLENTII